MRYRSGTLQACTPDGWAGVGSWRLIEQRAVDGDEVFTNLDGYSEIRVFLDRVTTSSSATRRLQLSTDNGAN